jgi:hypothetical protein
MLTRGGQIAFSEIVLQGHIPQVLYQDLESWTYCISGTPEEEAYRSLLTTAGFFDTE